MFLNFVCKRRRKTPRRRKRERSESKAKRSDRRPHFRFPRPEGKVPNSPCGNPLPGQANRILRTSQLSNTTHFFLSGVFLPWGSLQPKENMPVVNAKGIARGARFKVAFLSANLRRCATTECLEIFSNISKCKENLRQSLKSLSSVICDCSWKKGGASINCRSHTPRSRLCEATERRNFGEEKKKRQSEGNLKPREASSRV